MVDPTACKIVSEALALRLSHPSAAALDVLDLVMSGHMGTDPDFTDAGLEHGDHTDPRSPFGQLLAAAFDDIMNPAEWRNVLAQAVDPDPLLEHFGRVIVGERFAQRYRLWGAGDAAPTAVGARLPTAVMKDSRVDSDRVRQARRPF